MKTDLIHVDNIKQTKIFKTLTTKNINIAQNIQISVSLSSFILFS